MLEPEGWSGPDSADVYKKPTPGGPSRSRVDEPKEPAAKKRRPPRPGVLGAPVTAAMVAAAMGVTVAMFGGFDIRWMLLTERALSGEPWRILLSVLPHGGPGSGGFGVMHILFNSMVCWQFGRVLERRLGSLWTAFVYLFIAYASSLAQFTFSDSGIGLSGVAFGQIAMLFLLERAEPWRVRTVSNKTAMFFFGWFVLCIVLTELGVPIANWAHGVGALAGMLLGWLFTSELRKKLVLPVSLVLAAGLYLSAVYVRPYVNLADPELRLNQRLEDEISSSPRAVPILQRFTGTRTSKDRDCFEA